MNNASVLLVEDDVVTRRGMTSYLGSAGYSVASVASGAAALDALRAQRYDLMVTDIGLEEFDGMGLLVAARAIDPQLEVIIVTGTASIASAIAACNHDARRYLLKPVRRSELEESVTAALSHRRARIEQAGLLRQLSAQLLRLAEGQAPYNVATPAHANMVVCVGDLAIDTQRYQVTLSGAPVQLSQTQFSLLLYLARRSEQVIAPHELTRDVLGYECSPIQARELMKAHVHNLRQKIEREPAAPRLLLSRRGVGYMLSAGERSL